MGMTSPASSLEGVASMLSHPASSMTLPAFHALLVQLTLVLDPHAGNTAAPSSRGPGGAAAASSSAGAATAGPKTASPLFADFPSPSSSLMSPSSKVVSEELSIDALSCLVTLMSRFPDAKQRAAFPKLPLLPALGHCVYVVLDAALQQRNISLRVRAIEVIETLFRKIDEPLLLTSFLPGTVSQLCKIATDNPLQNHRITVAALGTLGLVLSKLFSDRSNASILALVKPKAPTTADQATALLQSLASASSSPSLASPDSGPSKDAGRKSEVELDANGRPLRFPAPLRNREWFERAREKIVVVVTRVCSTLTGHSSPQTHFALVAFCERVLVDCSYSLEKCVALLVDTLVALSVNEFPDVAGEANSVLQTLQERIASGQNSVQLTTLLEENVYALISSLPRTVRGAQDKQQLMDLNRLHGYFMALRSQLGSLLTLSVHLERLTQSLCEMLTFADDDLALIEEAQSKPSAPSSALSQAMASEPSSAFVASIDSLRSPFRKRFRHFSNPRVLSALQSICRCLGANPSALMLVDHLTSLLQRQLEGGFRTLRPQLALIINELLLGAFSSGTIPEADKTKLATRVITLYVSDDAWHIEDDIRSEQSMDSYSSLAPSADIADADFSLEDASPPRLLKAKHEGAVLHCLLLEGVAVVASALKSRFSDGLLMLSVHPLVEKLAHPMVVVSATAEYSLQVVARACGFTSIQNLVSANADYLINTIALNLRYVSLHPNAPAVLSTMLKHCNVSILPLLHDSLAEVLEAVDANHHLLGPNPAAAAAGVPYNSELLEFSARTERVTFPRLHRPVGGHASFGQEAGTAPVELLYILAATVAAIARWKRDGSLAIVAMSTDEDSLTAEGGDGENEGERQSSNAAAFAPRDTPRQPAQNKLSSEQALLGKAMTMTQQVLERCVHFLGSASANVRLSMLHATRDGLYALSHDSTSLLPAIHLLWPPVAKRCADVGEVAVAASAWSTLATICALGRDFVRQRFMKDAWPVAHTFLLSPNSNWRPVTEIQARARVGVSKTAGKRSGPVDVAFIVTSKPQTAGLSSDDVYHASTRSSYVHTSAFKLHCAILQTLADSVHFLNLEGLQAYSMGYLCLPSLSEHQLDVIQDMAERVFLSLAKSCPDATWMLLANIHPRFRDAFDNRSGACLVSVRASRLDRIMAACSS